MKLQFLGTSASPSVPLPFCRCEFCLKAREIGGKNYRKRASILINEDLMIDLGPDTMSAAQAYNISISGIKICLQTHLHEDHFDSEMIISRHRDYGCEGLHPLILAGSEPTIKRVASLVGQRSDYALDFRVIEPFVDCDLGFYQITGYPANHGSVDEGCFIYMIKAGERCLLYATDTSVLAEELWQDFVKKNVKFDLIILDCTYGLGFESRKRDHLAIKDFIEHVKRFRGSGLLQESGEIYATHISHEGCLLHSEYDNFALARGYHIAYDGLKIEM